MPLQRRSQGSTSGGKALNNREDKELGQKVIVQKNTCHFPRLPRPFQIFHAFGRKIWVKAIALFIIWKSIAESIVIKANDTVDDTVKI